jgi:cell division protein FtsZ
MPADLSRILQEIHRDAGVASEAGDEPLIQMEAEAEPKPEVNGEPLIESAGENYERPISVRFVGVGTFGANNLLSLKEKNAKNELVRFLGIHSDGSSIKELENNGFEDIISLESDDSKYLLGAGGDLESGQKLGDKYYDEFKKRFKNDDLILVVTGLGGGTGTGVAPFVAKAAKEAQDKKKNKLTIGIASLPGIEEIDKQKIAIPGIKALKEYVDALVVVDQMKVLEELDNGDNASIDDADELIKSRFQIVLQSIMDAVTEYTARNIEFADICSALKNSGDAIITTVQTEAGDVENIKEKLGKAINDKLLIEHSNKIASRLLIYPFYEPGYPLKNHYQIVGEIQRLFNWKKKDGSSSYSCDLGNLLEETQEFSKVGIGSGEKYKGMAKVIIMAAGFVDRPPGQHHATTKTRAATIPHPAIVPPPPPPPSPAAPKPTLQNLAAASPDAQKIQAIHESNTLEELFEKLEM